MFIDVQDGKYRAHGLSATCRESKSGNLMVAVKWEVDDAPGSEFTSYTVIVMGDGTVNERNLKILREIFAAWDGMDPGWFMACPDEVRATEALITIAHEADREDPAKSWPRVKWIDPPANPEEAAPDPAEIAGIRAKFGAKLRAVAAASKIQPRRSAAAPKAAPPAPSAPPVKAKKHDINSAWEACLAANGNDEKTATEAWQATLGGRDINAVNWDEVAASFASPLPF